MFVKARHRRYQPTYGDQMSEAVVGSTPGEDSLESILASAPFLRSREVATALGGDVVGLQALLSEVEAKVKSFPIGDLREHPSGVHYDIAGAMVEAHIEELGEAGFGTDKRNALASDDRRLVVIAALHYLITDQDVVPDWFAGGHEDDILVLRWATSYARGELPGD